MFSRTLKNLVQPLITGKQWGNRFVQIQSFEQQAASTVASPVIHNINVTGKVSNIFRMDNNTVTFYVRSMCPGNNKKMHKVCVTERNAALLDVVKTNLELEQRVNIEGKLNTIRFETDDGKHRSSSTIMATEVWISGDVAVANDSSNGDPTQIVDENSVELSGTITTSITGKNFRSFTLATLKNPNLDRSSPTNFCFNRIFVYDEKLFPILNDVRIKEDEFFIRGDISYRMYKSKSGKNTTSSYIRAAKIYRM